MRRSDVDHARAIDRRMVIDMVLDTCCIRDLRCSKGAAAQKRCSKRAAAEKRCSKGASAVDSQDDDGQRRPRTWRPWRPWRKPEVHGSDAGAQSATPQWCTAFDLAP